MQTTQTQVIFKGLERQITIDFTYNYATEELDYSTNVEPEIKDDDQGDFTTLLATIFMNALSQKETEEIEPETYIEIDPDVEFETNDE